MSEAKDIFLPHFPYLAMGQVPEIDFGFAKVWNFDMKKDAYIRDAAVKEQIERTLAMNIAHRRKVTGIGIFSVGEIDFRELNEVERELLRTARILLFLCFLAKNNVHKPDANVGHMMATSENFDVVFQRMRMGEDFISENTGEIVNFMIGGYRVDEVRFQKPSFIPTPMRFVMDSDLLESLLELRTSHAEIFERIISAGEIFLEGYYNSPYVSRNARVLLQLSAFEILLDLPDDGQRKAFKEAIGKYSNFTDDERFPHESERRGGRTETETLTIKEIWADCFYTLRNHIIHGHNPPVSEFVFRGSQGYLQSSFLFFLLCIRKQIEEALPHRPCHYEIEWEKWTDDLVIPPQEREGFTYLFPFRKAWQMITQHGI